MVKLEFKNSYNKKLKGRGSKMAKNKAITDQVNQDMIDNIKNYASQITSIKNFALAVQKMPGMYIGHVGNQGFINMTREIFQNSIDEMMKVDSPCNYIRVTYNENDNEVTVEDNGRGIPFNDIIRVFSDEHTSSNYTKKLYEYSSGRHGVGSKVTNALSSEFIIRSYILGEARMMKFHNGQPAQDNVQVIKNPGNKQGTIISFKPMYDIMGEITVTCEDVLNLVYLILPLTHIGSTIDFEGYKKNGVVVKESLVNKDGIMTNLLTSTKNAIIKPITMSLDNGTMKADIAFTYDSSNTLGENITSFSNFCPTISGSHVDGFVDGLTRWFRKYMNDIYLGAKSKISVIGSDIRVGLNAYIAVAHLEPIFTGQAKEILSNEEMNPFVRTLVMTSLDKWSKDFPNELQRICKYFKDVAEIRLKSEGEKVKLSSSYTTSVLTGMPDKYIKPLGKSHMELLIVEGDSARGSTLKARDNQRQGVFPIRGKIPNAFDSPRAKFLANQEIASIITIIGGGYGKAFDISKVKWEKIVFCADADIDGAHINSLLLRFFMLYMLPMITEGRVYRAVPPLYTVTKGKTYQYYTTMLDFVLFLQKTFSQKYKLSNPNGTVLTNNQVSTLLHNNINYADELRILADTYSVDPELLELVLFNINTPFKQLKKLIEDRYRFIEVTQQNGTIICKGLINMQMYTLYFNDKLIAAAKSILDIINSNKYNTFMVNGIPMSLYQIMVLFEKDKPTGITRNKGLGEQDGNELSESTVHPDKGRTLIRYTIEDANKEINAIRCIESNKSELFKNVTATRFDLG